MNTLYTRLKAERGLTDYKIAQDTGVPRSTISEWNAGQYIPRAETLLKIARYLNVSIEELLESEEAAP